MLSIIFNPISTMIGRVLQPNFKAVGSTEVELHILNFEKLDVCIRLLFANSVTNKVAAKLRQHQYYCC